MSGDFYKDWRAKAEVDYFPQLITLWLATNSWYRSHYSEITTKRDREFLEKLKSDHSPRNKLYAHFKRWLETEGTKEHTEIMRVIESLFFALNSVTDLLWEEGQSNSVITFQNCLIKFAPKDYRDLTVKPRAPGILISKTLKLTDDIPTLFNGLLKSSIKSAACWCMDTWSPTKKTTKSSNNAIFCCT